METPAKPAKTVKELEGALESRLMIFEDRTFGTLSRATVHAKAREVTAGMDLLQAIGEEAFTAFVDKYYDEDVFYLSKPADEIPPVLKRKRLVEETKDVDDDEAPASKRHRVDPTSVGDGEIRCGMVRCVVCDKRLKDKATCYQRENIYPEELDKEIVCLACWEENEAKRYCSECHLALPLETLDERQERLMDTYKRNVYSSPSKALRYKCQYRQRCDACYNKVLPVPTVVCLKRKGGVVVQDSDVYIGREVTRGGWSLVRSKWYNPYKVTKKLAANMGEDAINEVVAKYETRIRETPALWDSLGELRGKTLGCWCVPKPCHGNVLVKLYRERFGVY